MDTSFPTIEDFKSDTHGSVLKWRDLPRGVYKILSKRPTRSKFGQGMVLKLENILEEVYLSWAPARLVERLNEDTTINSVWNDGLKQSEQDSSDSYFAFSTACGCV